MFADFKMMGRLTKVPDYRAYAQDKFLCHISVAVNKKNEEPCFYNLTAFGKTADFLHQYFDKGQMVYAEGHLKQSTYEKDGKKLTKTEFIADKADFCGDGKVREQNQPEWATAPNEMPKVFVSHNNAQPEWATAPNEMPDDTLPF